MKHIVIILWLSLLPYAARSEPESGLNLPSLVSCLSKEKCDRNPKHLEEFLTTFYRWYFSAENVEFSYHDAERQRIEGKTFEEFLTWQHDTVQRYLTAGFSRRLYRQSHDPEIKGDPRYCNGNVDSDGITCHQNNASEWADTAQATSLRMNRNAAIGTVMLNRRHGWPKPLEVRLVPEKGFWRLERVNEAGGGR